MWRCALSQYSVTYHKELTETPVYHCTDILWSENPLIREQHDFLTYRGLLLEEVVGQEGLVCTCNGFTVGAIVFSELTMDSHFPGWGRIVLYSVTSRFHPQATLLLYRELTNAIRRQGGEWYQTTSRISDTEFKSKYRRIHG